MVTESWLNPDLISRRTVLVNGQKATIERLEGHTRVV